MQNNQGTNTPAVEGLDGKNPIYFERLLPGIFAWLLIAFMTASLGIAYGYVFGANFGILLGLLATVAIYFLMFISSPVIRVDELVLRVGDARIPKSFIGQPKLLDLEQTQKSRRIAAHRDAYLVMRASISESVLVEVLDVMDPHPYWQFSSRHPHKLISALESK